MYQLYATLLLTLGILILAGLYWWRGLRAGAEASAHLRYYLLAYGAIVVLAILVPTSVSTGYKAAILLGLLLTLLGTVARLLLRAPFVVAHALDLLAALLYGVTFLVHHPAKWPTIWLLVPLLLVIFFYLFVRSQLAELHSTLVVYGIVLWLLLWQAIEVAVVMPGLWSWSALVGVIGFVLTKTVEAINYLAHRPSVPRTAVMGHSVGDRFYGHVGLSPAVRTALIRWSRLVATVEAMVLRLATATRFSAGIGRLAVIAPLLTLFYQWLLVLSIWGPALSRQIGQLP